MACWFTVQNVKNDIHPYLVCVTDSLELEVANHFCNGKLCKDYYTYIKNIQCYIVVGN